MPGLSILHGRDRLRRGFTLTELLIVISVAILLLAVAVPSISSITDDARFNEAESAVASALTRAKYLAMSENVMIAIRFVPAQWYYALDEEDEADANLQRIVFYRWSTANYDPGQIEDATNADDVERIIIERFEPIEGVSPITLPANVWAAPIEAIEPFASDADQMDSSNKVGSAVLSGRIGSFMLDPSDNDADGDADEEGADEFLHADDFLIIVDPQGLVQRANNMMMDVDRGWQLYSFAPNALLSNPRGTDTGALEASDGAFAFRSNADNAPDGDEERYTRQNFSGVVLYPRDEFTTFRTGDYGDNPTASELLVARRGILRESGRAYVIHPRSMQLQRTAAPGTGGGGRSNEQPVGG